MEYYGEFEEYENPELFEVMEVVGVYNSWVVNYPAQFADGMIFLSIPSSVLPLSQKVANAFNVNPTLLDVSINLNNCKWSKYPIEITATHPVYKDKYPGRYLIQNVFTNFFSPKYMPKRNYRAANSLLAVFGKYTKANLDRLLQEGFTYQMAETALIMAKDNIENARRSLRTGTQIDCVPINSEFAECPLLYLVLEIIEAFLELSDHCCICRKQLQEGSLKPSVCDNPNCIQLYENQITQSSVLQEIRRDPYVADLLISCFCTSCNTQFLNPRPPQEIFNTIQYIGNIPAVNQLAGYNSDAEMERAVGRQVYNLIRWIILSNKSHFFHLPDQLRMRQINTHHQFLTLISDPIKEQRFRQLRAQYGSIFIWHGSDSNRWYPILRNGLRNLSGTNLMKTGQACGAGIYFGPSSSVSLGYCRVTQNMYRNSMLGQHLSLIALCEVAKVPELKNHGSCYTCTNEAAVIVRFLFHDINSVGNISFVNAPPANVPKLNEVLEYFASRA